MWLDLKLECTVGATQGRSSASLLREGTGGFLHCQRGSVVPRPVSASTSTSDLRVETEHGTLRQADVEVAGGARRDVRRAQDAPRDRDLQTQVAAVAEAQLEPASELERERVSRDADRAHAGGQRGAAERRER